MLPFPDGLALIVFCGCCLRVAVVLFCAVFVLHVFARCFTPFACCFSSMLLLVVFIGCVVLCDFVAALSILFFVVGGESICDACCLFCDCCLLRIVLYVPFAVCFCFSPFRGFHMLVALLVISHCCSCCFVC